MTHYRLPRSRPGPWPVDLICMLILVAAVILFLILA